MNSAKNLTKDLIIITLISVIIFGLFLGKYPLQSPDAARYAEIPREMLVTKDFITPHLNGIKYFEKPPLFYWIQAISLKAFGINEFAAGLPNALLAFGICLMVYFAGRKLYRRESGLLASVILATSILFFAMTRIVTLDLSLTFFISAALLCFLFGTRAPPNRTRDYYFWLFYFFTALATLTKGLVAIFLPAVIIFVYVLIYNEWRNLKNYRILSGGVLFLLIAAPWHILVQIANPEFFHFYFIDQHFLRYLTSYADREQAWWFLPIVFLLGIYPWTPFLLQALKHALPSISFSWLLFWKKKSPEQLYKNNQSYQYRSAVFLTIWVAVIYVFYTFSSSQLIPYLLPILPPLAIILGDYFAAMWNQPQNFGLNNGFKAVAIINILLGISIIIAINFAIDFHQEVYVSRDFYEAAAIMLGSGFLVYYFYHKHGIAGGFVVIVITMSIFLLRVNPFISVSNHRSIKPLAMFLKAQLRPDDEVVSFQDYYQDLPFYLQRIITVANYSGELEFGIKHMDASKWIINTDEFWRLWYSNKKVYMFTSNDNYAKLQKAIANAKARSKTKDRAQYDRLYVVKNYFGDVLLTNKQQ